MNTADYPPGLRDYFRQHNQRAIWIAFFSFLAAIASWGLVYFLIRWLTLLFLTVNHGADTPTELDSWPFLGGVAIILLAIGWAIKKWKTENRPFSWMLVVLSILSIPARLTFSVGDNLRALVFPTDRELADCWRLLAFLAVSRKISIHEIQALDDLNEAPDRLIFLLGLTDLAHVDEYSKTFYLHPKNEETGRLVRRWSRSLKDNFG